MSTTRAKAPLYNYIEGVEKIFGYRPGGYHPIYIGDTLHQRYRVVDKLGWGGCSTIWLARDTTLSRFVAVKVGIAASDDKELEILSRLLKPMYGSDDRGKSLFRPILDRFSVNGPNGTHPCSITTVARCSLAYLEDGEECGVHDLSVVRSLAAQLAIAVAYMHKQGFVHGDIHLGNILLQLPQSFDNMSDKQIYDEFGAPDPIAVYRIDGGSLPPGVPSHVFESQQFGVTGSNITLPESKVLLADLGTAFCPALESRLESYTPMGLKPPEARFEPTTPLSFASDIWGLACAIWHIAGREPFF
ncbi:hypothetical protein NW768_011651 [Fusarium equiseti]|uniref:non-specific serine/threonine protein kinase n=1 Tax=Fusarium equiseti TaxID=61235 RepID=A0ABQ8QX16_FUSEQ|nr:hypothetical protein NW768_011651 [Fusarium equiseti]